MKPYNVVTIVCVLIIIAACISSGYALYTSTLTDDETITVDNNYGTATLTESAGVYTLTYDDTTADSVYLTVKLSGLSSDYAPGTILDLWIGKEDVTSAFNSQYNKSVSGGVLTSLSKRLTLYNGVYVDGDTSFAVSCSADVITVEKNGTPLTVTYGNFHDGINHYIVSASGDTVNSVSRIITINGSDGNYVIDEDGYRYLITCSGSAVTSVYRCKVISASVDAMGKASFGTWTKDLTLKHWQDTIALYCSGTEGDLGIYDIDARFYSAEVTP